MKALVVVALVVVSVSSLALGAQAADIAGRPVVLDEQGKLLPWASVDSPYDAMMKLAWSRFKTFPNEWNGLPTYYTYPRFIGTENEDRPFLSGIGWAHNPASLNAMIWDSALEYAAYTGDEEVIALSANYLKYHLLHGSTEPTDAWAQVPYASSDFGAVEFRGGDDKTYCDEGKECGIGDGIGIIEPDKVGELGHAYLQYYERSGDAEFLQAAIHCADALAKHVRAGDRNRSPWPFRVDAKTGTQIREEYTSNVLGPIRLFDKLIRLRLGSTETYASARQLAWNWLMQYPVQNNLWQGYFEDIAIQPEPGWNPNQITPLETARYLLQHPEMDPEWRTHVRSILEWVVATFAIDVVSHGVPEPGIQWGAEVISEQRWDMDKMGSHTARYASVQALWYEKTGETASREKAFRSFNWATYFFRDNGVVKSSLDEGTGYWFSDGYGDNMRHYLKGMASVPEWAPSRENHLLRSTSVVQQTSYERDRIRYRTFDPQGEEVIRVVSQPVQVRVGGNALEQRKTGEGYTLTPSGRNGFVLRIHRETGSEVEIRL